MFAYCNNCPTKHTDPSGHAANPIYGVTAVCDGGTSGHADASTGNNVVLRDVTDEINSALREEILAIWYCEQEFLKRDDERDEFVLLLSFYFKVNDGCPWDIKLEKPWRETIGTQFPGRGVEVIYNGIIMTPEDLGNYTYGCLGCMYGFDLGTLYLGSEYAAGFPEEGTTAWDNEHLRDRLFIDLGYYNGIRWAFQ